MRRSGKVCWIGFVFSTIIIAAVTALILYFTIFRNGGRDNGLRPVGSVGGKRGDVDDRSGLFDHRSHAVPGGDYEAIDYDGDGEEEIELDGSRSHTHYFDEGPPVVIGKIKSMYWYDNKTNKELSNKVRPRIKFKTGKTVVGLTVMDNTRDTHTDFTNVFVRPPVVDGFYCYFYIGVEENSKVDSVGISLPTNIMEPERPKHAVLLKKLTLNSDAKDFPKAWKLKSQQFVARCVFTVPLKKGSKFSLRHSGPVRLVIGDKDVPRSKGGSDVSEWIYEGAGGTLSGQIIYHRQNPGAKAFLELTAGGTGAKTDLSSALPVLTSIDPDSSTLEGGGKAKIEGVGLGNKIQITFNGEPVKHTVEDKEGTSVLVTVPRSGAKVAQVRAVNKNGDSNILTFTFSNTGKQPIKFETTRLKNSGGGDFKLNFIAGIKYGPDHRFYAVSLDGYVYAFQVGSNLRVVNSCRSASLGASHAVLGLAFNYGSRNVEVYVSTSVLRWKTQNILTEEFAWANGKIHVLVPVSGNPCLKKRGNAIITGLPVTSNDHGVNGLVFDDDGKLHIQVGGFTNAGHNHADSFLGGMDENPLSAASLVADVNKVGFSGHVKYSSTDPSAARQIGGKDVKVFSPGWRNSFGINIHSNGFLYATDNGASGRGFGQISVSCTSQAELPSKDNLEDKLGKVIEGKYAGHPNRNRGREDPKQCKFRSSNEPSGNGYLAPIATFESSTNGVIEYTANTFNGQMNGDLILSKFTTDKSAGKVFRVQLDKRTGDLAPGKEPSILAEVSGLSIEMSPYGELFMPRVYKNHIVVLQPVVAPTTKTILRAVMPFRGSYLGGNTVIITGFNFGSSPSAKFDGKECTNVREVTPTSFKCVVPRGERGKVVAVVVNGLQGPSKSSTGRDYKYMNI